MCVMGEGRGRVCRSVLCVCIAKAVLKIVLKYYYFQLNEMSVVSPPPHKNVIKVIILEKRVRDTERFYTQYKRFVIAGQTTALRHNQLQQLIYFDSAGETQCDEQPLKLQKPDLAKPLQTTDTESLTDFFSRQYYPV